MYSLLICILLGFLLGLPLVAWTSGYYYHGTGTEQAQFPTSEMLSRAELRSLWVGVLIAVPSGAGVALSVLGGNITIEILRTRGGEGRIYVEGGGGGG